MPMERMSKQLAVSGQLKAEVRLGLAISEFVEVLDSKRRREFRSMQTSQDAKISGRDIIKMTEEINQEGARRHRSWRPHGTKVGGFLSRIQTFATIGDVLVGGSQNLIATGIWSAVRLSLTIATSYLTYFEKLSTLFMRLGTSWALHEDFARLFPASQELQAYFCEYLVVLMKLCNKIVVFCQKKTGAQLLSSLGSSFDSEFGPVQKELDQWGCLIQQQTQILVTKMATSAEKGKFQGFKQKMLRRLSPDQNDFETRWRRQRKKGTCGWIFDSPTFRNWESMRASSKLCVSGKLGSGKTVSMANIVAQTDLEQPCAHVFCAAQEPSSLKATMILGSIAFNLLDHLPSEAVSWREAQKNIGTISSFDPERIIDFLLTLLPEERTYIIIADGLEDCSDADMTDVLVGLDRLAQNRTVLLCYSSRSDSRFHHIAKRRLQPEFFISLDDSNHDTELQAYITDEVTRRNATRHLSPDLEELVKDQLIIGAQGMYLWASLQLDSIFPLNSNIVVTDAHILNLITHLPRDLPAAFEQALEAISDRQYEGRIMKLVYSAVNPLNLNEIRVALSVTPGEPVWHPEKIAKDGTQVISLCGGNLLELDEEDGKVRFIHHSVIQHLLSPAASKTTTPYHFTAEDAENFIGATCITYLHLPIFDTRIAVTKNLHSLEVLGTVLESTRQNLPLFSRVVQHIKSREHRRAKPSQFDIGHVLSQIQAARIHEDLDPRCFASYATSHWIFHTRFFDDKTQDCKESWRLWWRLLDGGVAAVQPPCASIKAQPFTAILWAVENAHGSLFRNILGQCDLLRSQMEEIVHALEVHKSIRGKWLGEFLTHYLESLDVIEIPLTAERLNLFVDLGADLGERYSTLYWSPIEILTQLICKESLSAEDERGLIRTIISHSAPQGALSDRSVLSALRILLHGAKAVAIDEILACRPDLKFEFQQLQKLEMSARSAIEKALDGDRWEEVQDLAVQGQVNTPTFSGTSLLWTAIMTKSDAWVYHLLRLGADPNLGSFAKTHKMRGPSLAAISHPLEAALHLRRTRVCLELLRHGADVGRLGDSPMQIALETGNWIIMARLKEVQDGPGRKQPFGFERDYEQHCTALATACKMLAHGSSREPLGFPKPAHEFCPAGDWTVELDKTICRLAEDEDAEYMNTQDADGRTALHYLSEAKDIEPQRFEILVNAMLNRGADPNYMDCHGDTPLWLAIWNSTQNDSVIKVLLKAGADPNAARQSHSFCMLAAVIAHKSTHQDVTALLKMLLQAGADPRDPSTPDLPDPSLILLATARGMEGFIGEFQEYTQRWNEKRPKGSVS